MPKIVPSILEETREDFDTKEFALTRVIGVDRIQVDFGDGVFVPHKTLSVVDMDVLNPAFHWEAHLMTQAPEDFLDYQIAGFSTIIIHYEAYASHEDVKRALDKITEIGLVAGLAFNPETDVTVVSQFLSEAKQFTLLSVHPGYQGGMFMPESIDRLKILRNIVQNGIIEVDGGVTQQTIKPIAETGVDLIVVGHALFDSDTPQTSFDALSRALAA